jgi:hypothetical protein
VMTEPTVGRSTVRTAAVALFGSRVPRFVIVMIVVVAVAEGAYIGVNYMATPWARAHGSRPPLVGYWHGEMVFEPGDTRQVALYLREFETVREFLLRGGKASWDSTPSPDIRLVAKVCGPKGGTRYHGQGDVANREGTRFTFALEPGPGAQGKHPSEFRGLWDGEHRLELTSRLSTRGPDGASATASIAARPGTSENTGQATVDGVIRFEMRRTTEANFNAVC